MKLQKLNYAFSVMTEMEKQLPFYLVGVGYNYEQEEISRPFGYPYYQWIHVMQGKGLVSLGDSEEREIQTGEGMMIFPGDSHKYRAIEQPWIVSWFTFGGYHIENLLKTFKISGTGIYAISHREDLDAQVEKGMHLLTSGHSLKFLECSNLVYSFVTDLYRYTSQEDDSRALRHNKLYDVFEYIEVHYKESISISDLAAVLNVTPQHLCTLFKKALHTRPFQYLNSYRINRSKALLVQHPDWRIKNIAHESGYDNEAYFSSMFKKQTGLSPSRFRRMNRG
ncbi:AraC family transcriptional regulator [Oceanispirochaeta sp.]|uniref:AraC family transcriptional regulator n=1 Tax=Oceanispirochaeta sp. TaxID=2035350 RepID=UPI00263A1408|nr:AraC family transcriptional regulator [Oceanispirochaeta sp.]MDA3958898.1 AraC family transcriptional regulator [Oceanispirochaeta sp.]